MKDSDQLVARKIEEGAVHGPQGTDIDFDTGQYAMGFGKIVIPPGFSANIIARPRYAFHPQRLIIPEEIGFHIVLVDIKIGPNSQIHFYALETPAHVFNGKMPYLKLNLDTCREGVDVTLMIRNVSLRSQNFTATLIGTLLDPHR